MQTETRYTQQESIYRQNLSTERQTLLFVDSDSEIKLTDTELAFIYGGQEGEAVEMQEVGMYEYKQSPRSFNDGSEGPTPIPWPLGWPKRWWKWWS